ncbi:MAG: alpha-ketoacid dehydrogenase subunit beta [Chloroflexia bacterium]|jgi:2-oxoisovalerate dehydrogenase E1 component|nr:alpha-ketoacid dehydrogenase subunit beta [Chloroflexia bacterium]
MREITYTEAAREGLDEEMARDSSVFVVGEGIGKRGGNFNTTLGLFDKYGPQRLRDTPIAERGFIGMCTGAAMTGTRPVVDFMFFDFILDATGEMINQIAKMQYMSSGRLKMPIVLRGCVGVGGSSATHHSGNYYSFYSHVPGWRVVLPTTPRDAKGLLKSAIRSDDPVLFLEHKLLLNTRGEVPDPDVDELIPFGKASVRREGTDVTAVAFGMMVNRTLEAAETLAQDGIRVEVIDPRSVAPLDMETILESLAKTGRMVIVDEDYGPAGMGAEIAALVADRAFDELDAPVRRVNGVHTPIPYSPPLEAAVVPNRDTIIGAIRDLVAE